MDITKTYQSDPRLSFEEDFMNNINSQSSSSSSSRHQPSQSQPSPPCTYEVEMEVRDPKVIENWLDTSSSSSSSSSSGVSRFVKYQTIIHSHMLSIIKRINPIHSISSLLDHSFNTLTVYPQFHLFCDYFFFFFIASFSKFSFVAFCFIFDSILL